MCEPNITTGRALSPTLIIVVVCQLIAYSLSVGKPYVSSGFYGRRADSDDKVSITDYITGYSAIDVVARLYSDVDTARDVTPP